MEVSVVYWLLGLKIKYFFNFLKILLKFSSKCANHYFKYPKSLNFSPLFN